MIEFSSQDLVFEILQSRAVRQSEAFELRELRLDGFQVCVAVTSRDEPVEVVEPAFLVGRSELSQDDAFRPNEGREFWCRRCHWVWEHYGFENESGRGVKRP